MGVVSARQQTDCLSNGSESLAHIGIQTLLRTTLRYWQPLFGEGVSYGGLVIYTRGTRLRLVLMSTYYILQVAVAIEFIFKQQLHN